MKQLILSTGAFFGFLSILLGAFGAHALKKVLSIEKITSFEVGVRYQMYNALLLLFLGYFMRFDNVLEKSIAYLTVFGTILFSGSIYLLSFSEIKPLPTKLIGPITPIGGLFLLSAWLLLFVHFLNNNLSK